MPIASTHSIDRASPHATARSRLTTLARLTLVVTLLVVVLSAYVRHRAGGLGCEPWPQCFGDALAEVPAAVGAARMAHRVVATLALAGVLSMVFVAWPARRARPGDFALAASLLAVVLGLSALGVVTAGSRLPAVAIGNLVGGFAMLALCTRLALPPRRVDAGLARAVRVALAFWSVQVLLGAQLSGSFSGAACGALGDCIAALGGGGWDLSALDPWRTPVPGGAVSPAAALLQLLHRAMGVIAAGAVLVAAWAAWRRRHHARGAMLAVAVVLQLALGVSAAALRLPLPLVLLHSLNAALVLSLLARRA